MSSEIVEDTILVLDVSRSMARKDVNPSRFEACRAALSRFVKKKMALNPQNNIGVVIFGEQSEKALFLTNDARSIETSIASAEIKGDVSYIGAGIAMAIQMHVDMLRQISGKVSRVVLFSDGRYSGRTAMDPIQMATLAGGLGIQIDVVNVGVPDEKDILNQVAGITGGRYATASDADMLGTIVDTIVLPLSADTRQYLQSKKPLMSDLAGELVKVDEMTASQKALVEKISQQEREKCLICHQGTCPVCRQPFSVDGRHCPKCASPIHLHCAAQWAKSDKKTDSNVFRCVHCYYLLKVPAEMQEEERERELQVLAKQQADLRAKSAHAEKQDAGATDEFSAVVATKVSLRELGADLLSEATCPVCSEMFEDEEFLFECINVDCGALYHPACFKKVKDASGDYTCKKCGSSLGKAR
nr:VWA domain-containing protein [Candidatus Sigynarchaeum springense]